MTVSTLRKSVLKSQGWRWDTQRKVWTWDDVTSSCIDAGNPGSPLDNELLSIPIDPNNQWGINKRINMGAYGGTEDASMPPYDWALVADFTNDGRVDFVDLTRQVENWLSAGDKLPCDLDRNGLVNIVDFASLAQDWLKRTTWEVAAKTHYVIPGKSIQAVIDDPNVLDGDKIILAPGTYYENINYKAKSITLTSTNPNNPNIVGATIIDGGRNGSVVTFIMGGDQTSVLTGIRITNGSAGQGGGIYCYDSNPTITKCIITGNSAEDGGGMFNWGASLTLTDCTFVGNSVKYDGGGISYCGTNLLLINCSFIENSARGFGGGIECYGSAELRNCTFSQNSAGNGGAIKWSEQIALSNCMFSGNSCRGIGGAVCNYTGTSFFTNCTFTGNFAGQRGGGISFQSPSGGPHESIVPLNNCIFWGNTDKEHGMNESAPFWDITPILNYTCTQTDPCFFRPGYWADANDPNLHVEPDNPNATWIDGDYHLKSQAGRYDPNTESWVTDDVTSPCIDGGDPMSPVGYEPFPNGGRINIGAYGGTAEASKSYFGDPVCETVMAGDINGDCIVDFTDFQLMGLHWMEGNN